MIADMEYSDKKLIYLISTLQPDQQNELFEKLSETLSKAELKALQVTVSYTRLLQSKELYDAMKQAVYNELYKGV